MKQRGGTLVGWWWWSSGQWFQTMVKDFNVKLNIIIMFKYFWNNIIIVILEIISVCCSVRLHVLFCWLAATCRYRLAQVACAKFKEKPPPSSTKWDCVELENASCCSVWKLTTFRVHRTVWCCDTLVFNYRSHCRCMKCVCASRHRY